jgi:hypothetical protein
MGHKRRKEDHLKKVLRNLPPNYGLANLYVNGAQAPVTNFITYKEGLSYFINGEAAVSLFNNQKIDGIDFAAAEVAEPAGEEEEA